MPGPFDRPVTSIDDSLRAAVIRRNAARAARTRRQGDATRARADVESYRRQIAGLNTEIDGLLAQRTRATGTCPDTPAELADH